MIFERGAACAGRCSFRRADAAERAEVETFVRDGFARAYRARVNQFMPTLMSLRRDANLVAACGLRPAACEPLFLERYLDRPAEAALAEACRGPVARGEITEVGNLVVARAGHARRLIVHLTSHLRRGPTRWVVFTAVPALRNNFTRLGIPLVTLGAASADRLGPAERADWGDYYRQAPLVTAVEVAAAHGALRQASCTR